LWIDRSEAIEPKTVAVKGPAIRVFDFHGIKNTKIPRKRVAIDPIAGHSAAASVTFLLRKEGDLGDLNGKPLVPGSEGWISCHHVLICHDEHIRHLGH
jgi:hypothetical protein